MNTDCAAVKTLWSWFPTMVPQGDGSVLVKPGKPVNEMTVAQAAKFIGCHPNRIYWLIEEGLLTCRRPLPHKTLIPAAELEAHRERTKDPEYWDRRN